MMKYMLFLLTIFMLIGCRSPQEPEPEQKSNNLQIVSLDETVLRIENEQIMLIRGMTVEGLIGMIGSSDGSSQTYAVKTSEGTDKSRPNLFDYDRLYVTSEDEQFQKFYIILLVDSFTD